MKHAAPALDMHLLRASGNTRLFLDDHDSQAFEVGEVMVGTLADRRAMMRSHGTIGHKYIQEVTQVIAGSVGLDDWEWGVSLHANDALVFKKLIYEMRFDPASALYAEFGPFYVGIRAADAALEAVLQGKPAVDAGA